ncbi:hypothetical protein RDI58_001787 [Solanum bulbocastanum]|uniref:FAD-binding PCMH-type domain-containing protein n=1 Tax=Solanum bulbocastanum TaxID=147425 RepID=A0AAN8UA70_SOLBU
MEERQKKGGSLVFAVNGERFELPCIDPSTALLQFLRSQTCFKSPKLGCGEGGCEACVVLVSKYDPELKKALGTPVMVSTLFMKDKGNMPDPPPGFSKLTSSEAEKAIAGNLCRCTGYRPIADACNTFAADIDIEDLGFNAFWKKGDSEFLKSESTTNLDSSRYPWYTPVYIKDLQSLLNSNVTKNGTSFKLVVGNTGTGYYKETQRYDHYSDLRHVPELSIIKRDQTGIEVGATVTIYTFISFLKEESKINFGSYGKLVSNKLAYHMEKIASPFVRNSANVGGNLVFWHRRMVFLQI